MIPASYSTSPPSDPVIQGSALRRRGLSGWALCLRWAEDGQQDSSVEYKCLVVNDHLSPTIS